MITSHAIIKIKKHTVIVIFIFFAALLTSLVGYLTYSIESHYLQKHSLFYDPVYYEFYQARLAQRLDTESHWSLALDEWLHNDRHPMRTVPLLLFYPTALSQPFGHLYTMLPSFFILLSVMTWFIYQRTKSVVYSLVGVSFFAVLPMFYDTNFGLATYWLEWQAAAWAGTAGICLLLALQCRTEQRSGMRWLICFAICAAVACLSRYVAVMFVFASCAPLYISYLWKTYQQTKRWSVVLWSLLIPSGIILLLAGYFLISHFDSISNFYSTYGYTLNQTLRSSLSFIVTTPIGFLVIPGRWHYLFLVACLVLCSCGLMIARKSWRWSELWAVAWLAIGPLGFLLVLKMAGAIHPISYSILGIILTVLVPMSWPKPSNDLKKTFQPWRWLGIGSCLIVIVILTHQHLVQNFELAVESITREKQFDQSLTQNLNTLSSNVGDSTIVWNSFFDEYTWIPTMEAYYQSGRLYLPAGQPFFNAHASHWLGDYPNLSPQQIAERVYSGTNQWVDVAVVPKESSSVETAPWLDNVTSRVVSEYVSERMQQDPNWQLMFTIESSQYGQLLGYYNRNSRSDNYDLVLHSSELVRP